MELLVDVLSRTEEDLGQERFYSQLAEAVCRVAGMRRALVFRYDDATQRVRAAGGHGVDLAPFANAHIGVESAPEAAKECLPLPSVTARCTADRRCGPGLTCTGVEGAFYCLVAVGGECFGDDLCASTFCSKNRCAASPAVGAACVENRCGLRMSCDGGACLKPGGYSCGGDAECVSRRCSNGTCASLGQLMDSCSTAQQCAGLICERGQCLKPLDAGCGADPECGSGMCGGGRCQQPRAVGERCNANLRCAGGLACVSSVCRAQKLPPWLMGLQASEALQAASVVQEQRLAKFRIAPQ